MSACSAKCVLRGNGLRPVVLSAADKPPYQKQNDRGDQRNDRMFDVNMRGANLVTWHKRRQLAGWHDEIHHSGNHADDGEYVSEHSHLEVSCVTRSIFVVGAPAAEVKA